MTLVKAGKTFLNGPGRRGKEQTETCPILMEQAPLQTRFGNDALLLGEKQCFFPNSPRLPDVIGLRVVLMSFLAIPHNGKFCDPSACFLKNKKDGVACRPSCRHTANPAACSIAGRKSWNKKLLSATSLHAANLMLVSARYFIPPPFSGKFFLELFSGEWTENNSNN